MASKKRVGAAELGIDLGDPSDAELFRWLVACNLFGARIRQELAASAFRELDADGIVTPRKLADAEWQHVVDLLGRGHYRRYDESTARRLIDVGRLTLERYDGRLSRLADGVRTKREAAERLQEFPGVGPTAAEIFLRDVWPHWKPKH